MNEKPTPRPEGELIRSALTRAGLSARKAADEAGISEGRWRQIVSGYQVVAKGTYIPVRGPAETIASMARVVGVTPEQLIQADREDAAKVLTEIADAAPLAASASEWDGELRAPEYPLEGNEVLLWRDTPRGRHYRLYDDLDIGHTFGADETPSDVIDDLRDLLDRYRVDVRAMERRRARR
ncbi:helix-turn-helix domain-containing protein [Nocardiopsis dassonvillei]|uniref:helix-turn-helix domain-containing protein n=1 Tax=Nocardiopsis dassonvillei TaxID=2014 RepID=UPI00157DCFC7|nr:helix-turn-helix transcriptional regulator [Nocardiopsis dassonvillei]